MTGKGTRSRRLRRRRLRAVAVLPSLVTLMNAVLGFAAIHFTACGTDDPGGLLLTTPPLTYFAAAGYMIFFAMVADALDGFFARIAGSSSQFGAQLDSLADMVSFGVAPAFLMLRVVEHAFSSSIGPTGPAFSSLAGRLLWVSGAMYVACAALRLARFNVETRPEISAHLGFRGLPSPGAAGVIAGLVLLQNDLSPEIRQALEPAANGWYSAVIIGSLPLVSVGLAMLMVSRVPYPHLVNRYVHGRKPFQHIVRAVILVLLLIWQFQLILAVGFLAFAGSGLFRWLWRAATFRGKGKATPPEPAASSDAHNTDLQ